ncbi:MAG TPA: acyl carrier protein [Bryobacteraceae bacterium]|jgi:acyl carrier protein|nr:acyl carrier protein [Bryobacteraceae bacterium]
MQLLLDPMTERETKIKAVVKGVSLLSGADPSCEVLLFDSGIVDSFGLADLVTALEQEFQVKIPESDLYPGNFASIQVIDTYLEKIEASGG